MNDTKNEPKIIDVDVDIDVNKSICTICKEKINSDDWFVNVTIKGEQTGKKYSDKYAHKKCFQDAFLEYVKKMYIHLEELRRIEKE